METINHLIEERAAGGCTVTVKELFEVLDTTEELWPQFSAQPKAFLQYLLNKLAPDQYEGLTPMSREETEGRRLIHEAALDEANGRIMDSVRKLSRAYKLCPKLETEF